MKILAKRSAHRAPNRGRIPAKCRRKPFGSIYHGLSLSIYWNLYYKFLGLPFMSSHIVYRLLISHSKFHGTDRVIDCGTGNGVFLNQLSFDYGVRGTGIDRMGSRIEEANKINQKFQLGNNFICSDFDIVEVNEIYDKALCFDFLEHVDDISETLFKIRQCLKKEGELHIQTPRGVDKKILLRDDRFLYGADRHIHKGFELEYLTDILKATGFTLKFWQPDFAYFSQFIYELLEIVRRKSIVLYSILWPITYPFCLLDNFLTLSRPSNGLYIIAVKN